MSKKMMKRSLALGVLMAFVITGSAFAAEDKIAEGVKTELQSGSYDKIVGGVYLKLDTTANNSVELESTNITFNGEDAVEVLGGSRFNQVADVKSKIGTTNLTILGGNFGEDPSGSDNVPAGLVVGGDNLKTNDANNHNNGVNATGFKVESNITSANLKIQGGNFNSLILGGSSTIKFYGDGLDNGEQDSNGNVCIEYLKAAVGTANTEITGGTFEKHIIVAGGMAWGKGTESTVDNAVLKISNSTIGVDVYAGGVTWKDEPGEAIITNGTDLVIVNSEVKDIYGCNAYIYQNGNGQPWQYETNSNEAVNTTLKLTNVTADDVVIPLGSVTLRVEDDENTKGEINIGQSKDKTGLTVTEDGDNKVTVSVEANGAVNDAYAGDYKKMVEERFKVEGYDLIKDDAINDEAIEDFTVEEGEVMGAATLGEDGKVIVQENQGNTGIKDIVATGLISWRYEMNDMNKRMGELRNANGEHGVWVRMVRGETEYNSVKNQYNQYQLGYDEKLSVDPSWTVGVALSYTEADNNFSKGTGESTNKALSIYGSKLNDDGTFIDLIAKYARLENDFDLGTAKGDYDTNGYSFSAEYGKRIQQGNGLWIEPQVELTYGQVDGATYMVGGRTVNQDNMESLIGRVGFSLGKDISKGNVYARASYLYDFEGETSATFSKDAATDSFEQDLGGGWWEVGVGANINLSKATYIYADIEKTFGGEVDTNWQWNLGVRYSF